MRSKPSFVAPAQPLEKSLLEHIQKNTTSSAVDTSNVETGVRPNTYMYFFVFLHENFFYVSMT